MSRQRVVVLFGGKSVEREVSKVSARAIVQALDPAKYEVVPLAVGPDGRFLSATTSAALLSEKNVPEKILLTGFTEEEMDKLLHPPVTPSFGDDDPLADGAGKEVECPSCGHAFRVADG